MENRRTTDGAPMEGGGAYNRNAVVQASAAVSATPLMIQAARLVSLPSHNQPFLIADYGSSQGRNSLLPIRSALTVLRGRLPAACPVSVVHTDLPGNDFSTLFRTLESDPDSYLRGDPDIFPSAIGRSFYERLFAPESVSLGWSCFAVLWLSRLPALIPEHIYVTRSTGVARAAFERQAAEDWSTFLLLRAVEMRPGARIVIVSPARDRRGLVGVEPLMDAAKDALDEMAAESAITSAERQRMCIPAYQRNVEEILTAFASGALDDLIVEHCDVFECPDPTWDNYQTHRDPKIMAAQRSQFFRSTFVPTLASALESRRAPQDIITFAERLSNAVAGRIADQLVPMPRMISTLVVAKRPS